MSIRPYEKNNLRDTRFDDFYDMIDSFFNDDFTPQKAMRAATFKVDVIDEDKDYKVEAELPGFSKDEIDIDFEEGKLTITAEKNEEVNEENMSAKLEGGILEITIPKKTEEKKNKKIEIK